MKNLIIRSFWNSDIYFDNVLLERYNQWEFENKTFVEKAELLTNKFDKYKDKIQFRMFDAFLEQYKSDKIQDFVGIFTKQNNKYSKFDTFCLYPLFEKYIKYKKVDNIILLPEKEQIIFNDAYDEKKIFDILNIQLLRIKENIENIWYDQIKINITWWTKIMAILLTCSMKFIFENQNFLMYYGLWDKINNQTKFIVLNDFTKYC